MPHVPPRQSAVTPAYLPNSAIFRGFFKTWKRTLRAATLMRRRRHTRPVSAFVREASVMGPTEWDWVTRVVMAASGRYASASQLIRTRNCASAPHCAIAWPRCQRQTVHNVPFVNRALFDHSHEHIPIMPDRQGQVTSLFRWYCIFFVCVATGPPRCGA